MARIIEWLDYLAKKNWARVLKREIRRYKRLMHKTAVQYRVLEALYTAALERFPELKEELNHANN